MKKFTFFVDPSAICTVEMRLGSSVYGVISTSLCALEKCVFRMPVIVFVMNLQSPIGHLNQTILEEDDFVDRKEP